MAQGVVLYLLKPFTFETFRAKPQQYAAYPAELEAASPQVAQDEVDRLITARRPSPGGLPKGMSPETMREITAALRSAGQPLSATETAELVGTSRVTARRYLEHLADGRSGRPAPALRRWWPPRGGVPLALTPLNRGF